MSVRMNQAALKEEERKRNSGEKEDPIENEITLDDEELTSGKVKIEEYSYGDIEFIIPPYAPISGTTIDENGNIQIKTIEAPKSEKLFLCAGAQIKCSKGTAPNILKVLPDKKISLNGQAIATKTCNKGMINIMPFGACQRDHSPPCTPNISGMWTNLVKFITAGGEEVPCEKSKCNCSFGGIISIINPGQSFSGASSGQNNNSDEKDEDKNEKEEEESESYQEIVELIAIKRKSFKR